MSFDELPALPPAGPGRWTAPGTALTDEPRAFGGLLLAQAIVAASGQTRRCHALHALFIGAGSPLEPFEIAVERTRDGRSFATRRIEIRQNDRLLLAGFSSHHDGDEGPRHQITMPDVPSPDALKDQRDVRARRAEARGNTVSSSWFALRRRGHATLPDALRSGRQVHQQRRGYQYVRAERRLTTLSPIPA